MPTTEEKLARADVKISKLIRENELLVEKVKDMIRQQKRDPEIPDPYSLND